MKASKNMILHAPYFENKYYNPLFCKSLFFCAFKFVNNNNNDNDNDNDNDKLIIIITLYFHDKNIYKH